MVAVIVESLCKVQKNTVEKKHLIDLYYSSDCFVGYFCVVVDFMEVFFIFRILWLASWKLLDSWAYILLKKWVNFSAVCRGFSLSLKTTG